MADRSIFLRPKKIIDAGDMTAASLTSIAVKLEDRFTSMLQFIWTDPNGDAVGTFDVQGCLDAKIAGDGSVAGGTWNSLPGVAPKLAQPAGAASSFLLDLGDTAIPFVRVVYTKTTGTGAPLLTVLFCAKG